MARPAMNFNEMTRDQQLRRCQYLRAKGDVNKAESLKKLISPATKTRTTKSTKIKSMPTKIIATKTRTTKSTKTKNQPKLSLIDSNNLSFENKDENSTIPIEINLKDNVSSLNEQNKKFFNELKSRVGSSEVKLIDLKSGKKFTIDQNEGIKEVPTLSTVVKESLYRKWVEIITMTLSVNVLDLSKKIFKLLPLILMATVYSAFLMMQGQDSYKLMGLPYHNILAVGMVVTLGVLKFWTAISDSFLLKLILVGIVLFEGFVLYSGTEINLKNETTNSASRKVFLTGEVKRLEEQVTSAKKEIKSYETTTNDAVKRQENAIDLKKNTNEWSKGGGVLDLSKKLEDYRNVRANGLSRLKSELNISNAQKTISTYKSELVMLTDTKTNLSDKAVKALIALVLLLNMYVFHRLGVRFRQY